MITVNMHDAKTRLSELVKMVEERNETVILRRHGTPVAELRRFQPRRIAKMDRLKTHSHLKVTYAEGYRPDEPLQPDELADNHYFGRIHPTISRCENSVVTPFIEPLDDILPA